MDADFQGSARVEGNVIEYTVHLDAAGQRYRLRWEVLPDRLLLSAEPSKRDILVELCLTVPVRLTHLLPYLSYLMQPLVFALRAGPDLVAQGLRTLELCIDNLTQEFLDQLLIKITIHKQPQ